MIRLLGLIWCVSTARFLAGATEITDVSRKPSALQNLMSSLTLPVFVLLRLFFYEQMTQCIYTWIKKKTLIIYFGWRAKWNKKIICMVTKGKKRSKDGKPPQQKGFEESANQRALQKGSYGGQRDSNITTDWAYFNATFTLTRWTCPLCQYEFGRPSISTSLCVKSKCFLQIPTDENRSFWGKGPCTQNYIITVHMFIYS